MTAAMPRDGYDAPIGIPAMLEATPHRAGRAAVVSSVDAGPPGQRAAPRGGLVRRLGRHPRARAALLLVGPIVLACLLAPLVAPDDGIAGSLAEARGGVSLAHLLGTDELGRDVVARLLWGGRVSLAVGLLVTIIAMPLGTGLGLLAGSAPTLAGSLLMRVVDATLAIPRLPLYLVLLTLAGPGFWTVVLVMALFEWTTAARLSYTGTLGELHEPRIEAARSLGAGPARILLRHVLPNMLAPLVVAATAGFRARIVAEASLSYLGFGIAPPVPSWGNMLAAAQSQMWERPSLAVYPGVLILLVTIGANLLGDALRDALDPTAR